MSDLKEEKKVDIKVDNTEEVKEETSDKKGEIQVRNKYRPLSAFKGLDSFFKDLDRFFLDFWSPSRFWDFEPLNIFEDENFFRTPLTNIIDEGDHFTITAELPGLEKGDIEISVRNGALELKGEQKNELKETKEGFVRKEYSSSSYYRSFTLPENIDEDKIEAKLEKGILKLNLPKIELKKEEKKKIEVK